MKINSISQQYNYTNTANKNKRSLSEKNTTPAFKGAINEPVVKGLTKLYTKVAGTQTFKKMASKLAKSDNSFTHLMVAESALLSGFYMFNTLKNKKIDKEQKPQMLINDTLVWGVSTAGAYLVDGKISNWVAKKAGEYTVKHDAFYTQLGQKAKEASQSELFTKVAQAVDGGTEKLAEGLENVSKTLTSQLRDKVKPDTLTAVQESVRETITSGISGSKDDVINSVKDKVDDVYNVIAEKAKATEIDKLKTGFNKLRVLVIVGLIYRFLGPVVITPIANKLSKKIIAKKNDNQNAQQTVKTEKSK